MGPMKRAERRTCDKCGMESDHFWGFKWTRWHQPMAGVLKTTPEGVAK